MHRLDKFRQGVSISYLKKDIRHRPGSYQVINNCLFTRDGRAVVCNKDGCVFVCQHGDRRIRENRQYIAKVLQDYSVSHSKTYNEIIQDHFAGKHRHKHKHRNASEDVASKNHSATPHPHIDDNDEAPSTPKSPLLDKRTLRKRSKEWIRLMSGEKLGLSGYDLSLQDLVNMPSEALEHHHTYIQWLFPNKHISHNNPKAPLITHEIIEAFQNDKVIRYNVKLALNVMLEHMGVQRKGRRFKLISKHKQRWDRWMPAQGFPDNNHNQARLSRILEFLNECGSPLALPLHDFLQKKRMKNGLKPNPHWSRVIGVKEPSMTISSRDKNTKKNQGTASPKKHKPHTPVPSTHSTGISGTKNIHVIKPSKRSQFPTGPLAPYHIPTIFEGKEIWVKVTGHNYSDVAAYLAANGTQGNRNRMVQSNKGCIRFYNHQLDQNTYYLSNTYIDLCPDNTGNPVKLLGLNFPSAEHAFQYQKLIYALADNADQDAVDAAKQLIFQAKTGGMAANHAQLDVFKKLIDKNKWRQHSERVMHETLYAKFKHNEALKAKLIGTYPCVLIEHTANDGFYGNNNDDTGLNLTGQILGQIRERIMREEGYFRQSTT